MDWVFASYLSLHKFSRVSAVGEMIIAHYGLANSLRRLLINLIDRKIRIRRLAANVHEDVGLEKFWVVIGQPIGQNPCSTAQHRYRNGGWYKSPTSLG